MAAERKLRIRGLSDRDRKVIDHVARYRLTTIPALKKAVLHGLSSNAVAKIANRLTSAGYLQKFTLLHPARYFMLGGMATAMLGRSGRAGIAPGSQSLPTDYGLLAYATLGKQSRPRMRRSEVLSLCPWLPNHLASAPHCYDAEKAILELIRVDLGGSADHVARKCVADLRERLAIPEFARMVAQSQFRLVVITATREKAVAIQQAMNRHEWPSGLTIHLSVVSHLLSLIARTHHA
jgi:hypothetical protein